MNNELIKTVLGLDAGCFKSEYVETGFEKCYMLVQKIMNNLDQNEKELLYQMLNYYDDDMYKFVKYFIGGKSNVWDEEIRDILFSIARVS